MKITRDHTTLTDAGKEVVLLLSKLPEVSKVSPGIIKQTKSKGGRRGIKFLPITGGIKAVVRGSGTVQEIYIYTKEDNLVKQLLSKLF